MPNWTTNEVTVRGEAEQIEHFRGEVRGENGEMDFDRLAPMPESLAIEKGSRTDEGLAYVEREADSNSRVPDAEVIALGRQALENIRLHGVPTWYEWRGEHWGTKWNACDTEVEEYVNCIVYRFDTANDAPRPLVGKLVDVAHKLGLLVVWDAEHDYDGSTEVIVEE